MTVSGERQTADSVGDGWTQTLSYSRAQSAGERRGPGRPRSIPERLFVTVLRLKLAGLGYRAIANELNGLGVSTSRGSVERLVKGLPPYDRN